MEWKPVDERILMARFQTKQARLTIIQAYTPTDAAGLDIKENFYDKLQLTVDGVHRYDILLIIGDFNAKVTPVRRNIEGTVGPFTSSRVTNENGENFCNFCTANGFCIGNTFFQHKRIHKWTWCSPDGKTSNEIDYICISKRWRRSLYDVRSFRGADIGSDHS